MRAQLVHRAAVLVASLALVLLAAGSSLGATNWPMWLENSTHAPSPELRPTGPFSAAWSFECGGVFGTPIVDGGAVYIASRDGYLYAVDDATGEGLWRASISVPGAEADDPQTGRGRFGMFTGQGVMATPAVDAERVYIGGLNGSFVACDRKTGRVVWTHKTSGQIVSSAAVTQQSVVVGSRSGEVVALNPANGSVRWTCDTGGPVNSSPAIADGRVIVGTVTGVVAIGGTNGKIGWRYPAKAPEITQGENDEPRPVRPYYYEEEEELWPANSRYDSSPCVSDGTVYVGRWDGTLVALNLSTGALKWDLSVSRKPIFATPAARDGKVYVAVTNGMLVVVDAATQSVVWHAALGEDWGGPASAYASPVLCGPVVLVGCNRSRIEVRTIATGEHIASLPARYEFVHATPAVTDHAVYIASESPARGAGRGAVSKLVSAGAGAASANPDAPATKPELIQLIAAATGLELEQQAAPSEDLGGWELAKPVDWRQARNTAYERLDRSLTHLQNKGLQVYYWSWGQGALSRFELAAFYHKALWDPNPFGAKLPDYEPPTLADADTYPAWVSEMPAKIIGLGLLEAKANGFCGRDVVTNAELQASVKRFKQLLPRPDRAAPAVP